GGRAGGVRTEGLAEEDPQGDQGRKDPVQPAGDAGQRLLQDLFGEDGRERQIAVLKELPSQEARLLAERCGVRTAHPGVLLAGDGMVVANPPCSPERPPLPIPFSPLGLRSSTCHSSDTPTKLQGFRLAQWQLTQLLLVEI